MVIPKIWNKANNTTRAVAKAPQKPLTERQRILHYHCAHYIKAIDHVYRQFGIMGEVIERRIAPRYLTVGVTVYDPKQIRKAVNLTMEIAHVAGIGQGTLDPPINTLFLGNKLVYQFNLPEYVGLSPKNKIRLWKDLYLSDLYDYQEPDNGLLVGMGLYETPVYFGFQHNAAHALVCGTSGSGKSELLKTITFQLMYSHSPDELGLAVIDPKGDLAEWIRDKAHLLYQPVDQEDDIALLLAHLHKEYQRRRNNNLRGERTLVLIIDEADDDRVLTPHHNNQRVLDIAQRGRSLNMHILVGTHKPDQDSLGHIGTELTNRFLGKVVNAQQSGQLHAGLNLHLLAGMGDFYHVVGNDRARFQAALITEEDTLDIPTAPIPNVPPLEEDPPDPLKLGDRRPAHRPPKPITGRMLAHYLYFGPDNIQLSQAQEWNLTRREHERHKQEAKDCLATYARLRKEHKK